MWVLPAQPRPARPSPHVASPASDACALDSVCTDQTVNQGTDPQEAGHWSASGAPGNLAGGGGRSCTTRRPLLFWSPSTCLGAHLCVRRPVAAAPCVSVHQACLVCVCARCGVRRPRRYKASPSGSAGLSPRSDRPILRPLGLPAVPAASRL